MMALLVALLAQPFFEKDPWDGCKEGSWVKFKLTRKIGGAEEYTVKYAGREGDTRSFEREPAIEDWEGAAVTFAGYVAGIRAGYKRGSKSSTTVTIGRTTARALVEQFAPNEESADPMAGVDRWRATTCDAVAGGLVKLERDHQTEGTREKWSYEFKAVEKLKVGDRTLECLRFDHEQGEGKKKTVTSTWLCGDVPGLVVKTGAGLEVVDFKKER